MKLQVAAFIISAFALQLALAAENHDEKKSHPDSSTHSASSDKKNKEEEHHHEEDDEAHGGKKGAEEKEHEEEASASVGPGMAIEEVAHDKGFRLSEKALKTLNVKTMQAANPARLMVPKKAIVTFGADRGIYRLREKFFKLLDIKVIEKRNSEWVVQVGDLLPSDQVVIDGTGLLRVAELEASGGGSDGHGH